jgi:hypothetical protein
MSTITASVTTYTDLGAASWVIEGDTCTGTIQPDSSSQYLYAGGFDLSGLPDDATVDSISVTTHCVTDSVNTADHDDWVTLTTGGVGSDGTPQEFEVPAVAADVTVTATPEVWMPEGLTAAQIKADSFGVLYDFYNNSDAIIQVIIDRVTVEITYTEDSMAATFDPSLSTLKDHIRLAIGDTDTTAAMLADETIAALLAAHTYPEALAQCCDALVTRYGQRPDEYAESGGVKITWGERCKRWSELADNARAGKIKTPTATRTARTLGNASQTTLQDQTTATARTESTVPTLMEGFRPD